MMTSGEKSARKFKMNDQPEINFSETYTVWPNFEVKIDQLNDQTDNNAIEKIVKKLKRAR